MSDAGILGIISLHTTDFLVVITNRKRVAHVLDSTIYLATDFRMLPISSDANPLLLTHPVEKKLLGLVKESLYSGPLYFSYEYDLTSSMQHQIQQSAGAAAGAAVPPMWQRADERFFWNRHLQERFIAHARAHPGASLDAFIMPVMFGFIEVKLASVNGRSFVLGLVARRSRHRAGTRYFSRGVDADGHVSNSVETEQFVLIDPPSLQQPKDMEDVEGKTRLSFVQTRGSVPVFWAEVNTLRYKPDLLIPDDPRTGAAISRHFAQQVSTYGKTYIVNLVNQSGYEKPVKEAFERAVQYLNNPLVSYTYFDFHHACKGMKFDRAALVFDQLEREGFALDDYFSLDTVAAPRLQLQKSVVRTNCMDCLDRTNVVQSLLARCVLTDQLRRVGVFTPRDRVEDHPKLLHLFRNVWADHADVISKAYSGTGALKTDFTRTGKRSTEGLLQDGVNSLWRYLKNNLADGKRQDAYDLITGAWDSAHGVPHADTRAWHVCLMPWLLLVALVLALAGVVLPAADVERPYAVDTGKVPVFVLVWVAVALYALLFIWQHGVQYVGWPTLNHPEHLIQYSTCAAISSTNESRPRVPLGPARARGHADRPAPPAPRPQEACVDSRFIT